MMVLKTTNIRLKKDIEEMKQINGELEDNMYNLEVDLAKLSQYTRRENLQIRGIPNSVKQRYLEAHVINILAKIGVKVQHYNIAACHRLYNKNDKYPADTIIRFVNRKDCYNSYANKKKLRDIPELKNIRFLDNLCPAYKRIYRECSILRQEEKIKGFWSYKGTIYINMSENIEDAVPIYHEIDLDEYR